MADIKSLLNVISQKFETIAKSGTVVGKKVSVGHRHVVPLCELSLGFGGGGGTGESEGCGDASSSTGTGGGAGGGVRIGPLAVIVVDGDDVRVERIE